MSTRLTRGEVQMVDSQSLQLVLAAAQVHEKISLYLSESLKQKGYKFVSPTILNFLSTLECGINYASEIARTLGVSRQMVAKTVKELCNANYLEQREGVGKQKQIIFTKAGELLMSDTRLLLAGIDRLLDKDMGEIQLKETVKSLENIKSLITQFNNNTP